MYSFEGTQEEEVAPLILGHCVDPKQSELHSWQRPKADSIPKESKQHTRKDPKYELTSKDKETH